MVAAVALVDIAAAAAAYSVPVVVDAMGLPFVGEGTIDQAMEDVVAAVPAMTDTIDVLLVLRTAVGQRSAHMVVDSVVVAEDIVSQANSMAAKRPLVVAHDTVVAEG